MADGVEGFSRHGEWHKQKHGIVIDSNMFYEIVTNAGQTKCRLNWWSRGDK